jgi:hypothetical protein
MPARQLRIDGRTWRVYPGGFLTQSVADEFSLLFVSGAGDAREVRLTRFSPVGTRSREQAVAELDEHALRRLFLMSQSSARSPEAGYRA